jgi:peptide/nickel transport system substrate-binding protein
LSYDGGVVRPQFCTALVCLAAAGCGGTVTDPAAAAAQARAGLLTIAYAAPRSGQTDENALRAIVGILSDERLVALSRDGRFEPRLAEGWTVSPDGLTWRIRLRQGLQFQNGDRITSAAVRAAIQPPPDLSEGETLPGLRDLLAIETPAADEIVLRLKRPNALLLEGLAHSAVNGHDDASAGPFTVVSRQPGRAALRRFDRYYRGRSALDAITVSEYPSHREAWSAMLRGDVDMLYDVGPDAFEFVQDSPNASVATYLRAYVTTLAFNTAHPTLGRRDVRRALNLAIDRVGVIRAAAGGRAVAASDHIWPSHWARDPAGPVFAFDASAARAELDRAGLRPGPGGAPRFRFTCLVVADQREERLALLLQRQLLAVDVDMRLEAVPLAEFGQRLAVGRFDAFQSELVTGFGLGFTYLAWHSTPHGPYLRSGYSGATDALDRVRAARTDDETRAAVRALQHAMHDDPPAVFLYWRQASRAVNRRFVLPAGGDQDILRTVDRWRLADGTGGQLASASMRPGGR